MKKATFNTVKFLGQGAHIFGTVITLTSESIVGTVGEKLGQGTKSQIKEDMREATKKAVNDRIDSYQETMSMAKKLMAERRAARKASKEEVITEEVIIETK